MRHRSLLLFVALACACEPQTVSLHQPTDRLYYPTGMLFVPGADASHEGTLYVANSNWDKRYATGVLAALVLDDVRDGNDAGLPPLESPYSGSPQYFENLNIPKGGEIDIDSLAGDIGSFPIDGGVRLFIPSRSDNDALNVVDARNVSELSCGVPYDKAPGNCGANPQLFLSRHRHDGSSTNLPAAPWPQAAAVAPAPHSDDGDVYITHLATADSPAGSGYNPIAYLVHLSALQPVVTDDAFIPMPMGGSNSVAVGSHFAYVSGRTSTVSLTTPDNLFRMVNRTNSTFVSEPYSLCAPEWPCIKDSFQAQEGRGLVLSSDEKTIYMLTREPDALLVLSVGTLSDGTPDVHVAREIPLPSSPDQLVIIPRPSLGVPGVQGNLVAITSSAANSVVFYDDNTSAIIAQVRGVGVTPYSISMRTAGTAARLYITSSGDGRIAVLDVPDVSDPSSAFVRAYIGKDQTCLVRDTDPSCQGYVP